MASQRDQQKEIVRLLSLEHGYKKAAQLAEVDYALVRQWAVRGKWKEKQASQIVTRAADNLTSELQEYETETRLSLARSARRMAKDCEELPVRHADKVYTVAKTMAIVHRQDQGEGSKSFTLNVLNLGSLGVQVRQENDEPKQVGSE